MAVLSCTEMFSEELLNKINTPVPINFDAIPEYKNHSLHFAMNAGMEITNGGRLYTCWIGGEDGAEAYLIVTYSDDSGKSWKDIQFVIDPHSDELPFAMNTHVGGLWLDPTGRLWLFYQQSFGMWDGAGAVFALVCEKPDAPTPKWNDPVYVSPGAVIKKPVVLSNGEWLLPVSIWERWHITPPLENCHRQYDDIRGANAFVSKNQGVSWEYRGGVIFKDSCFNEHSLVELSDGRIMMMSRCKGAMKKSYSRDFGKTWSEEEEYFKHILNDSSMATLRKLSSGNLLLIKHGMTMDHVTERRSHLTAFISKDDGKTFEGGLLLDERAGVSYPDICEGRDGTIYVQYDYKRAKEAQLLFARFRESDVLSGKCTSDGSALGQLITSHRGITGTAYTLFDGAADGFGTGSGSIDDPYRISSAAEYGCLARKVYEGEAFENTYFLQSADLDFGGNEIVPVGAFGHSFHGHYDGNGFYMQNFKISGHHIANRALFGSVCRATVKNIKVRDGRICGRFCVAAVIGTAEQSVVENCIVEDSVQLVGYTNIGGIAGLAKEQTRMLNCKNYAQIKVPRTTGGEKVFAGGIVGRFGPEGEICSCENYGDIIVRYAVHAAVGGIAGGEEQENLSDCKNSGDISVISAVGNVVINGQNRQAGESV